MRAAFLLSMLKVITIWHLKPFSAGYPFTVKMSIAFVENFWLHKLLKIMNKNYAIFLVGHHRGSTWFSLVWETMGTLHPFSPVSAWKEKSCNGLLPLYIGFPLYLWWIVSL